MYWLIGQVFVHHLTAYVVFWQRLPVQAASYWRLWGWEVLLAASFCSELCKFSCSYAFSIYFTQYQ